VDTRLHFDPPTVLRLAEHAHAASPATAALVLVADRDGIYLASNGQPPPPAPADQPGTVPAMVAFAEQCPPGTPWLERVTLLRGEADLAEQLPLSEPESNPLIGQLHAAARAGRTTITVLIGVGGMLRLAVSRRRQPANPAAA